jgi:hypothetical protein
MPQQCGIHPYLACLLVATNPSILVGELVQLQLHLHLSRAIEQRRLLESF